MIYIYLDSTSKSVILRSLQYALSFSAVRKMASFLIYARNTLMLFVISVTVVLIPASRAVNQLVSLFETIYCIMLFVPHTLLNTILKLLHGFCLSPTLFSVFLKPKQCHTSNLKDDGRSLICTFLATRYVC